MDAWAPVLKNLRKELNDIPVQRLWGLSVFFPDHQTKQLIDDVSKIGDPSLILPLESHVAVLAPKFSLPGPN